MVSHQLQCPVHRGALSYLGADAAADVDARLMATVDKNGFAFRLEQLMELAGLAVAQAVFDFATAPSSAQRQLSFNVLVICGPGNNGGDGLVAARHLALFGLPTKIVVPKAHTKNEFFRALLSQACGCGAEDLGSELPSPADVNEGTIIVDAIFGFSFKAGSIREPFDKVIATINQFRNERGARICAVDIPSGWHVDHGLVEGGGGVEAADMLVSLTLPKKGVKNFKGAHYIGGRFVPKSMGSDFDMPAYSGSWQIVRVAEPEFRSSKV